MAIRLVGGYLSWTLNSFCFLLFLRVQEILFLSLNALHFSASVWRSLSKHFLVCKEGILILALRTSAVDLSEKWSYSAFKPWCLCGNTGEERDEATACHYGRLLCYRFCEKTVPIQ